MEKMRHRLKALFCRVDADSIKGSRLRMALVAPLIGIGLAEAALFVLLQQSVRAGELPAYVVDILICSIALLEVIVGPVLGWWGHTVRRSMLVRAVLVAAAACCLMFFMPRPSRDESSLTELCVDQTLAAAEWTWSSITRVTMGTVVAASLALCRVTCCSHALAYLHEHDPTKLMLDVGVLVGARLLILVSGVLLTRNMVELMPWLQLLLIILPLLVKAATLQRYPLVSPNAAVTVKCQDDRGLRASVSRVLSSPLPTTLGVVASLLAAGLWAFFYHNSLLVKIKYNVSLDAAEKGTIPQWSALLYYVTLVALVLAGLLVSGVNIRRFSPAGELKKVTYLSMLAGGLYLYLTFMGGCGTGELAGLSAGSFAQPACSRDCGSENVEGWMISVAKLVWIVIGMTPVVDIILGTVCTVCIFYWVLICVERCSLPMDFAPVCVPEQQLTYYSPCHAGCAATENRHQILVYANCSCGVGTGIASVGACGYATCSGAYSLHQVVLVIILTLGGVMLQSVFSLLIRTVDPRDAALAVALCGALLSLFTFVCTHAALLYIRVNNCAFPGLGSQCHFPSAELVTWSGALSSGLTFLAGLVALGAWLVIRRRPLTSADDVDKDNDDVVAANAIAL